MQKTARLAPSTRIKDGLNAVLKIAGLQVSTTKHDRLEQARLEKLVAHEHWAAAPFHDGLCFEPDCYFNFLRTVCAPYVPDWGSFPRTADAFGNGYFLQNGWFESIDAEVLYSVVRHFRPRTILEIGSGHSSRLARRAIDDGQLGTRLVCVDPSPRVEVRSCADEHKYLLYALLIGNPDFEILWPSCYMWQFHRDQVRDVIVAEKSFPPPSSFWLRKKA